jgi:cytochrome c peroxidase
MKPIVLATLLVAGAASVQAADAAAPQPAALRAKAKDFVSPVPDRMPGSENDTPARIALGKQLYMDKRLSKNDSQSCNTCHDVTGKKGGVDNEPTSEGAFGKRGDRNSPTSLNAGFHFAQFWDGRAKDLKEQAKGPVLNPVEMAMPDEATVVKKLAAVPEYQTGFTKAFPGQASPITYDNIAEAIAAFERTLITHDRLDDFLKGDDRALSAQELKGLDLFLSIGCTTCHNGPVLGGNSYQKVGLIHPYETKDLGRFVVTKEEGDENKFKVPSLRNIAITGPWFHDGKQTDLKDTVTKMAYMQLDRQLKPDEADALVAFLNALTDKARAK